MPKFTPNLEDYTLRDVLAARQALREDDTSIQISSEDPIRCSAPACRKDVKVEESWIIVNAGGKVVVWHMRCMDVNAAGEFDDPSYRKHLVTRLESAGLFAP